MNQGSLNYWQQQAQQLTFEGRAYINGNYQTAMSGEQFDCISPIDGKLLVQVSACGQADADLAVTAARNAFNQGDWRRRSPAQRKLILQKFADLIEANAEQLALLETLDMGKPISDALNVDIPGALRCLRWTAEAIDKVYDEIAPSAENELGMVTHEPVGVVAAIVPWNFPLLMACWKLAPALATGNSVILKPSEKSPLTAIKIAELATQAGIPDGVFNVLPGFGHSIGKALALHHDVDTLVFTGSTAVAKQLFIYAGQSNMKRVWTEAGGKSPNIVFADAPDLDAAAQAAAGAICFNQGEVCTAGSRLLVEASIKDEFVTKVVNAMKNWRPGHPLDPNTNVGAIVDKEQQARVIGFIEQAQAQGGQLRQGGKSVEPVQNGFYIEPTIFDNIANDMDVAQQEIFGPVLSVISFDSAEDAINIANDSEYGLAAGVWTRDLSKAHRVAKSLRAGSVWVNQWDGGDMTAPFGGYKQSGNGRDKSLHAFSKYTEVKATWIKF
ncbi:aldehyde dehydrogenase [Thalassotalea mangrovi]|uniref:Aldehyde dehydrogenase n=1 Tax=Thalassotalea mangrovi TaxID=2572245 RepID=A0A4U1B7Y3_9GAMM|nr:aldehyde dehydrogenase [Thalassotalea mangrovi]TKB46730.1 aldehyde dehydrogenase [Thalassotalea mangrovi]